VGHPKFAGVEASFISSNLLVPKSPTYTLPICGSWSMLQEFLRPPHHISLVVLLPLLSYGFPGGMVYPALYAFGLILNILPENDVMF
jgi:hypothetical protein